MTCADVRLELLGYERRRLAGELERTLRAHLQACPACAREDAAEEALTELLEQRLPQYPASFALKRRLAEQWPVAPAPRRRGGRQAWRAIVAALAVALGLLIGAAVYYRGLAPRGGESALGMVAEAVNDHLRILASQQPLEVEGGGLDQVRTWFEGRLDFAPMVRFAGDDEFPLQGAAVGYFLDRKAAVFVFHRRLHTISLLVFRADGLPWPTADVQPMGALFAHATASRGFNVLLWTNGPLGYALVSDVEMTELWRLGAKLAGV